MIIKLLVMMRCCRNCLTFSPPPPPTPPLSLSVCSCPSHPLLFVMMDETKHLCSCRPYSSKRGESYLCFVCHVVKILFSAIPFLSSCVTLAMPLNVFAIHSAQGSSISADYFQPTGLCSWLVGYGVRFSCWHRDIHVRHRNT